MLEYRDGFLLNYNYKWNVGNWYYEYVEEMPENLLARTADSWLADTALPLENIVTNTDWKRDQEMEIGHFCQWSLHQGSEKEKKANRLSSNAGYHHRLVNRHALAPVERIILRLPSKYYVHVFTGTIIGKTPELRGKEHGIQVAEADKIFKLLALKSKETGKWYYDGYLFPNDSSCEEDSSKYRSSIKIINEETGKNYLSGIKDNVKQLNIFELTELPIADYRHRSKSSSTSTANFDHLTIEDLKSTCVTLKNENEDLKNKLAESERLRMQEKEEYQQKQLKLKKRKMIIDDDE